MKPLSLKAIGTALIQIITACTFFSAFAEVSLPPFYESASKIKPEGKLGQVIKKEKVATKVPDAQAWRIAYISSDVNNLKTISTGLLIAPVGKAPEEGRPIVSWSHGTTGSAQNSWTDYGVLALPELIKEGYVVVATDYQGLGGGGKHQYSVGQTQGNDAINAIRAAGAVKETGAGKKVLLYGWSQGGYSVLSAGGSKAYLAQKGTAFAGIDIVGIVAVSPVNLSGVAQVAMRSSENSDHKPSRGAADFPTLVQRPFGG